MAAETTARAAYETKVKYQGQFSGLHTYTNSILRVEMVDHVWRAIGKPLSIDATIHLEDNPQ